MSFRMKPANKNLKLEKKEEKKSISYSLFDDETALSFLDTVSSSTPRTTPERTQTPRAGSNVGISIRSANNLPNSGPVKGSGVGMAIRRTPTEDS